MMPERKSQLEQRWQECERQIQAIHAGKVLYGDPAEMEGTLLEEQDAVGVPRPGVAGARFR